MSPRLINFSCERRDVGKASVIRIIGRPGVFIVIATGNLAESFIEKDVFRHFAAIDSQSRAFTFAYSVMVNRDDGRQYHDADGGVFVTCVGAVE